MDLLLYIIIALLVVAAIVMVAIVLNVPIFGGPSSSARANLKNIVQAQRAGAVDGSGRRGKVSLFESAEQSQVSRASSAQMTLRKRLKYAQWKISPMVFHLLELGVSIIFFGIAALKTHFIIQIFVFLISGPLFMRWLLNLAVERRFKAFDADYAPFLMSLVSLLKTGMNPMTALEAAAQGLEDGSLVRMEVEMMIERLRFGVPEERSIGSFGEDIFHSEIELFVQALLLARRVGGTLSDTLERLARQVRRRQYFRASANAAVGLQRGSIWFIIGILVALELYLWFVYPQAVTGAMQHEVGWVVWQFAGVVIFLGMFWVRQVTKIRV